MKISQISSILNRNYPMLLIDGVTHIEQMAICHAFKNLTYNEWFFPAHFPGNPIMPGSLQIEAFTQAVALPLLYGKENISSTTVLLAGVDKTRFYKPVTPGNRLDIFVKIERVAMGIAHASAQGRVNNEIVSECKITYKLSGEI